MAEHQDDFNQLVDDLNALTQSSQDTLKKALDPDGEDEDKKILAAEGDGEDKGKKEGGDDENIDSDEDGSDDDILGKSMTVTLEDGTKMEAFDGGEMLKSLIAENKALAVRVDGADAQILKAMNVTVDAIGTLQKAMTAQAKEISELKKSLDAIGDQGRGRKTLINVHEKTAVGGNEGTEGISGQDLLSKALSLQGDGKMNSSEVALVDTCVGRGELPPENLLKRMGIAAS